MTFTQRALAVKLHNAMSADEDFKELIRDSWEAGEICLDLDRIKVAVPGWDDATVFEAVRLVASLKGWRASAEDQELRFLVAATA